MLILYCQISNAQMESWYWSSNNHQNLRINLNGSIFGTILNVENKFIIDQSRRKRSPSYIKLPLIDEHFDITGPRVKIEMFVQSKEKMVKKMNISSWLVDSLESDKQVFTMENLEIRTGFNAKILQDWTSPMNYPSTNPIATKTLTDGLSKNSTNTILETAVAINDSISVDIRTKKEHLQLFHLILRRIETPVTPFLATTISDSSSKVDETQFIQNAIAFKDEWGGRCDEFYSYWPVRMDDPFANQKVPANTKIAFLFRKPDKRLADSTMEFQLYSDTNIDSTWHKTGSLVILPSLLPNRNYNFSIRYRQFPNNIFKTNILTGPLWYQTNIFKLILVGFLLIVFLVLLYLFYRSRMRNERQKKERLGLSIKAVQSQLNPHFIFNALGSIQSLILKNDIENANNYLSQFASLMRNTLTDMDNDMVPLDKEINNLRQYLNLEFLRLPFAYNINTADNINIFEIELPTLLLQPITENAVKHGLKNNTGIGQLIIEFKRKGNDLVIAIIDNGTGFEKSTVEGGYGLKLTKARIELFNQIHKHKAISMNIQTAPDTGTSVILTFTEWLI